MVGEYARWRRDLLSATDAAARRLGWDGDTDVPGE